jgi:hypothetical protein
MSRKPWAGLDGLSSRAAPFFAGPTGGFWHWQTNV